MQSQCSFHLVVKSCDGRSILLPCCVAPSLSWTPHRLRTLAYRPHCVLGTRNVSQQGGQYSRQLIVCARGICRRGVSQFPRCRAWNICGFSPIFYFKRRDTNFNLPQEYPDLHALHSFNAIFRLKIFSALQEGATETTINWKRWLHS